MLTSITSTKQKRSFYLTTAIVLTGLATLGCGGGGKHHSTKKKAVGSARLLVDWPSGRASTNEFAPTIQNLKITIWSGSKMVMSQDLVKPNASAPFDNLPVGQYKIDVRARETEDESGPVVAGVGIPLTIIASQMVDVHFSLTTPIEHMEVSPSALTLEALSIGDITLTARDASNNVTLASPTNLRIESSDPSVATADPTGIVTAGALGGTTTIRFNDVTIGKSGSVIVTVLPPPALDVSPSRMVLAQGQSQAFSPALVGLLNTALTWSVAEGDAGGRIDSNGRYTAPKKNGIYHVVATSVSRPALSASAMVIVGSGSENVNIH